MVTLRCCTQLEELALLLGGYSKSDDNVYPNGNPRLLEMMLFILVAIEFRRH